MNDRLAGQSPYVAVEGTILAAQELDVLCQVDGREIWVRGGVIFNEPAEPGPRTRTILLPRWLARHHKLL